MRCTRVRSGLFLVATGACGIPGKLRRRVGWSLRDSIAPGDQQSQQHSNRKGTRRNSSRNAASVVSASHASTYRLAASRRKP